MVSQCCRVIVKQQYDVSIYSNIELKIPTLTIYGQCQGYRGYGIFHGDSNVHGFRDSERDIHTVFYVSHGIGIWTETVLVTGVAPYNIEKQRSSIVTCKFEGL